MKKIIFFVTFLFFILGINYVSAHVNTRQTFNIGGKNYEYIYMVGQTMFRSSDGLEKIYPYEITELRKDFGNGLFYFVNNGKIFYIKENLELETKELLSDPNNCSFYWSMSNGEYSCDNDYFESFNQLRDLSLFGKNSFIKSYNLSDYEIGKNTIRVKTDNHIMDHIIMNKNFDYSSHVKQTGYDSILYVNQNSDKSFSTVSYNFLTKEVKVNDEKFSLGEGETSIRLNYDYNGTYRLDVGSQSQYGKIEPRFLTTKETSGNLPYTGLNGKIIEDDNLMSQIDGNGEPISCKRYDSEVIPTCLNGQYLKLIGANLFCTSGTPVNKEVNFTLINSEFSGIKTFNYYKNLLDYPSCAYLKKKDPPKNPVPDPDIPPVVQPITPPPIIDNNGGIGGFFSGLGSKITSGLKTIKDGISSSIDKTGEVLSGVGSKITAGMKTISDGISGAINKIGEVLSGIGSKISDGFKNITSGLGKFISDGFESIKGLFTGNYGDVILDNNGVDFGNLGNVKTDGDGFLNINQGNMSGIVRDGEKCKLFNENNYTFLYYSNGNFAINFSLKQYAILDNSFGSFFDFIAGLFIGPINNIMGIVRTFTPFTYDNQQVCLFGEVKTITFHKFMQGTENYGKMTIFDYIVLFTFSGFIFFLIGGTSFFRGVSTPEGQVQNFKYIPYSKGGYIVNDKIK